MLLGGLWHGAAWTFVIWGAYHGLLLVVYQIGQRPYRALVRNLRDPRVLRPPAMVVMFALTLVGWVVFRANSVSDIGVILGRIGFACSDLTIGWVLELVAATWLLILVQIWQQATGDLLAPVRMPVALQIALFLYLFYAVTIFGAREPVEFIYFQF